MAVMTNEQRKETWAQIMRTVPTPTLTKAELRAAVDAIDAWINDNAAAFNAALPLPARTNLSAADKSRLLAIIALARYNGGE